MKSIGILFLASLIGLNIYNYNNPATKIDYEFVVNYYKAKPIEKSAGSVKEGVVALQEPQKEEITLLEHSNSLKGVKLPKLYAEYFIEHIHLAKEVEKLYNIPAEICLAQAIQESGCGTSYLGRVGRNHFGIKAMKKYRHIKGKSAKWTAFDSVDDCYMAYGRILHRLLNARNPNYKSVTTMDIARTPYAGTNNFAYAAKLDRIIQIYNIKEFVSKY